MRASAWERNRRQLAFEGGEEALAQRVVVGVADRAHGWAQAGLTAAVAERDRGVLRALVGVVNDVVGSPLPDGPLERVEHQFRAQVVGHRPTDHPAAEGIEDHHRRGR